ncbi:MAG: AI-2E family transporter [Euryarchaeota archaeon]|jgi:predicted PurR-regulated permease PerM|nr:AI-2E family transporter [Euryarchaeota archaeon]
MNYKWKGTITSAFFVVLVLLLLSFLVIYPIASMVILGAIFAYGIRPLALKIEPKLKFRSLAIAVAMVVVILPLIALLAYSINTLISSSSTLVELTRGLDLSLLNSTSVQQSVLLKETIPASIYPYITSILNIVNVELADIIRFIVNYILEVIESIPMLALQIFIFLASTFYIARDGGKLSEYIQYTIPKGREHYFENLYSEIERVLKSIFYGHFLTAIIIGLMAGIGFYLLGYPYALFLGILTGFFQLIPILGPWPVYTVLTIWDIISGNYIRAVAVLLFGIFLSGSDIYIRPQLSGKYADIHPLIFILGFLSGPLIFGLVGFILGPLILGVAYAAVVAYKNEEELKDVIVDKPVKDDKSQ